MRLRLAIAAAVAVRVVLMAVAYWRRGIEIFIVPDSIGYLQLAEKIATRAEFTNFLGAPEIFRTPGYPLLLSIGFLIGHPILFALIANVLLTIGIVAVVHRIAFCAPALCAFVVALEPTMLTWSLKVMPETLFVLLLVLFLWAAQPRVIPSAVEASPAAGDASTALGMTRSPAAGDASTALGMTLSAGVALSAAAYVKPIAWPLVFIVFLVFLFRARKPALVFLLACVVLLAPWHIRNSVQMDYAGFSTLGERALYLSVGGSIVAQREHRSYYDVREEMLERADVWGRSGDPAQYGREGAAIVASDPFGYAKTHVKGMLRTLLDPGATEYLRFLGIYSTGVRAAMDRGGIAGVARAYPLGFALTVIFALALLPLVVLPLFGVRQLRCRFESGGRAAALQVIMVAYFITVSGGVPGTSRFRVPAVPMLVLLSACALPKLDSRR